MSDIDVERVAALFAIVESASKHSGKLAAISGVALNELMQLNESLRQKAMQQTKEEEAKAKAAAEQPAPKPALSAVEEPTPSPTEDDTQPEAPSIPRRV